MAGQRWSPLRRGDLVDVIAPGMRPHPDVFRGLEKFLNRWGLRARLSDEILGTDLLCAAPRNSRWQSLHSALLAPDSKMIWCLRGGYGSLQLLPDLSKTPKAPCKVFLGLSDITSLHLFLNQKWNWSTIHGCNLDRFALGQGGQAEERRLRKLIFAEDTEVSFRLQPLNEAARRTQTLKSSVVGGNLITLQSSLGTPYSLDCQGRFLFVEEIGERAYRVDRVFQQMSQMNLLKGVRALIFGQFTGGREPDGRELLPRWMREFAREQKFPVLKGLPSGHGPNQAPLPLNTRAELFLTTSKAELRVHSGGGVE